VTADIADNANLDKSSEENLTTMDSDFFLCESLAFETQIG